MNHALAQEIEDLSSSANAGKVRLQLFIEWWVEYCSNHGDVVPWLEGAESRLEQLVARAESTQSPLVSPVELLQDAKVYQCCGDVIMMSWCQSLDVKDSIHTHRYQTPALSIGTLVYQYKWTRAHTCPQNIHLCTRMRKYTNIQTHTYLQHTHTHTYTHPHIHTHACIHTHILMHAFTHTNTHIPTQYTHAPT